MDKEQIELLEEFVDICRLKPSILQSEDLKFFREWLLELGAKLPVEEKNHDKREHGYEKAHDEPMDEVQSSEESDLDISMEGVIDCDEVQYDVDIGDPSLEVTEQMQDESDEKRSEALSQFREGNYDQAITLFTEAIKLSPTCAMLYAKRASCLVKMKCPNAAIKDCNKSFEFNPDSALAYKWRGISNKLLGNWEEAFSDLTQSLKLDYSDDAYEHMKDVESKAKLIREHKRKYERKREDKKLNEKREKVRRAQEANEKAKKSQKREHDSGGAGSKFPGMGGPGGLGDLLNDPELVEDLKDPEVMAALTEIMSNPSAFLKHQGNPKIAKIMRKMQTKFGGEAAGMGARGQSSAGKTGHCPKTNSADDLD